MDWGAPKNVKKLVSGENEPHTNKMMGNHHTPQFVKPFLFIGKITEIG